MHHIPGALSRDESRLLSAPFHIFTGKDGGSINVVCTLMRCYCISMPPSRCCYCCISYRFLALSINTLAG
jgi:hypothetical protein